MHSDLKNAFLSITTIHFGAPTWQPTGHPWHNRHSSCKWSIVLAVKDQYCLGLRKESTFLQYNSHWKVHTPGSMPMKVQSVYRISMALIPYCSKGLLECTQMPRCIIVSVKGLVKGKKYLQQHKNLLSSLSLTLYGIMKLKEVLVIGLPWHIYKQDWH